MTIDISEYKNIKINITLYMKIYYNLEKIISANVLIKKIALNKTMTNNTHNAYCCPSLLYGQSTRAQERQQQHYHRYF